jgi:CheY-like chemotaxis protein
LLVEDSEDDVLLIEDALAHSGVAVSLEVVQDGYEALESLERGASLDGAALPELILLDLNLPGMDGLALLDRFRGMERLRHLPVLLLTTSKRREDSEAARLRGAQEFVTKPIALGEFREVVGEVVRRWARLLGPGSATSERMIWP